MARPRRVGSETSETRALLLDVTERIMVDAGYAAVSSRRVAKAAEVTPALVHYYFGTLDDLFIAVLRRRADRHLARQQQVLASSPNQVRALWDAIRDPTHTGLILEFASLANHRKAIRSELAALSERFRVAQRDTIEQFLARTDHDLDRVSSLALVTLINAVATSSVLERSIGMQLGLDEAAAVVEEYIGRFDP